MGSSIPVRDLAGKIVGLKPSEEGNAVQATLEASLKAMGAVPTVNESPTPTGKPQNPQWRSWRLITGAISVLSIGVIATFFASGRTEAPTAPILHPTVTSVSPTKPPTTALTILPQTSPRDVILSPITLYGDYDEDTRIGAAPQGLVCILSGQSPDGLWAFLSCPVPTGEVWARTVELDLSTEQRSAFLDARIVRRIVSTVPAFSPPSAQEAGLRLAFCADRSSIWGTTHQCAATQAVADALADSEIGRINATAEAIQRARK